MFMTDSSRRSGGAFSFPSCRVLHLVDPGHGTWANLEALARLTGIHHSVEHHVVTIGGVEGEARADRAGVKRIGSIHPPLSIPMSACSGLRQMLRHTNHTTVVHAWSSSVAFAARLAGWRGRLITTLEVAPKQSTGLELALRKTLLRRCGRLIVGSTFERSDWLAAGAPIGAITIIPRPIAPQSHSDEQRQAIRKDWGVNNDTIIVASLDVPTQTVDAFRLVYVTGVAAVAKGTTHPILSRSALQLERAIRFTERHNGIWSLTVDHRDVSELISAIDLGIWFGGTTRTSAFVPLLELACARGLSVIALDDPRSVEVCKGVDNAQIVHSRATTPLTRAILDRAACLPASLTPCVSLLDHHDPVQWLARMEKEYRRALGLGSLASAPSAA